MALRVYKEEREGEVGEGKGVCVCVCVCVGRGERPDNHKNLFRIIIACQTEISKVTCQINVNRRNKNNVFN